MRSIFPVRWARSGAAAFVLVLAGCGGASKDPVQHSGPPPGMVTAARVVNPDGEADNWLTLGRDRDGTYYSPLKSINDHNATQLGFAWQYDLGDHRGQEATPIVVDGVMYTSGTWGFVYAVDAATGRELWKYDPHPDPAAARNPCCDLVNRGVAVWEARVYVVAVDGRLHAVDARTGQKVWDVDTIADHHYPYSSTGAPQIAGKVIVVGNSGSDMGKGGVRGYVSAYDLATGALKWRFYTVPPAPGKPLEHPELEAAAKTWDDHRDASFQGGGTAWDGFAYDPDLNLVYFGTANSAPYDGRQVGPKPMDHLYTASILALDATSGRMAWYYQTTPYDHWDYDAVQKMVFARLTIGGKPRDVLMQANKNGFFYVIDRKSGELLSAEPYATVNWASRVDMKTGRPVLSADGDWYKRPQNVFPSWAGAHTWMPMSFSRATGLVYIPTVDMPSIWVGLTANGGRVHFIDGYFTANGIIPDDAYDAAAIKDLYGPLPTLGELKAKRKGKLVREILRAWDPVAQKVVWEHETASGYRAYDGGVLSTAGNLVIQGRGNGELWIYAADTGAVLKVIPTGSHIMAAPITYAVNGVQYVAVQAGYGGTGISVGPIPDSSAATHYLNTNRIIAFRLDGPAVPTPMARVAEKFEVPPEQHVSSAVIRAGEVKFVEECSRCHQFGLNVTPDLRRLTAAQHAIFKDIVLHGAVAPTGMEKFDDLLSEADADAIHAYLIDEAWKAYKAQEAPTHH